MFIIITYYIIYRLKNDFEKLSNENRNLSKNIIEYKNIIESQRAQIKWFKNFINCEEQRFENKFSNILSEIFTDTQIQLLLHKKKKVYKWAANDISSAITLRSISPKAYRYLKDTIHIPLPGL